MEAPQEQTRYTWEDYQRLPDDARYEVIGGQLYNMTPAPTTRHQIISGNLNDALRAFFKGTPSRPFYAPLDVKLSDEDIVQPDLLVVCDKDKIKPTHIEGGPDLVIEILSPSTEIKDRTKKLKLYARAGVREVWIVTPFPSCVEVYFLKDDAYFLHEAYSKKQRLTSGIFPDLKIDLDEVFDFPLEPGEELNILKEDRADYTVAEANG